MATVVISLPDQLLQEIDEAAQAQRRSRNELLQDAAERYLHEQRKLRRWESPSVQQAVSIQDRLAQQDEDTGWDPVEEIRHIRESRR